MLRVLETKEVASRQGPLRIVAASNIELHDKNLVGSTWSLGSVLKLSTAVAEWNAFKSNFGQTSLLNALSQAFARAVSNDPTSRGLNAIFLGDSHVEGQLHSAVVSGAETLGATALNSPLDEQWQGDGTIASVFSSRSAMYPGFSMGTNVAHPNTDGNIGTTSPNGAWIAWVPQILRASYPRLGRIRIANFGYGGTSSYTWSGNTATGFILAAANANDGDTVTISGQVYRLKNTPVQAYDVQIGASANATLVNLGHCINADGIGGYYGAGEVKNAAVFVGNLPGGTTLTLTSRSVGIAGNGNILAASAGAGTRVYVYQQMANGDNTGCFWGNALTVMNTGSGFGTPDIVFVMLGTNDASRIGWFGSNFQAHVQRVINNVRAQWPSVKIVLWYPPAGQTGPNTIFVGTINPAVDALLAANQGVSKMDAYNLPAGSGNTAILSADGVHMTVLGYQYIAQLVAKAIVSALGITK